MIFGVQHYLVVIKRCWNLRIVLHFSKAKFPSAECSRQYPFEVHIWCNWMEGNRRFQKRNGTTSLKLLIGKCYWLLQHFATSFCALNKKWTTHTLQLADEPSGMMVVHYFDYILVPLNSSHKIVAREPTTKRHLALMNCTSPCRRAIHQHQRQKNNSQHPFLLCCLLADCMKVSS
jgi:hypothetical protein